MTLVRSTSLAFGLFASLISTTALAQTTYGAPPPDAKALVVAPAGPAAAPPDVYKPNDSTNVTLAAGGQLATGNSQLLAGTVNGKMDLRRGYDAFGASLIGNYGQGATSPGAEQHVTTENLQGRVRYDRYMTERFSIFLIDTERHDRFQGLAIRTNLDPGVKYLFVNAETTTFWGELGYDFQYDVRLDSALPVLDATTGLPTGAMLSKTATQQSGRLFAGFKHAFNTQVTFVTGLEYLQGFASSTAGTAGDYRLNYDALFAANVGGGFSVGLGFSARYDHDPLPGKVHTDTASTISLIYSFSEPTPAPPPPPPCVEPAPPPPPAPSAAPAAPAPSTPPGFTTPPAASTAPSTPTSPATPTSPTAPTAPTTPAPTAPTTPAPTAPAPH